MSLEQSFERIAIALEKLANPLMVAEVGKPVGKMPEPVKTPEVVAPTVMAAVGIKNSTLLKEFAQKYLMAAGEQSNEFVKFIKEQVCAKFTPKEPKLIKVPDQYCEQAAQMIFEFALSHNIIVK